MSDDLVPVFIPALVVLLLKQERAKGTPLTRSEVEEIRDRSVVMQMDRSAARSMAEDRGYEDIDPDAAWEEWRVARRDLLNPSELDLGPPPADLLERVEGLLGASPEAIELSLADLSGLDREAFSGTSEFWSWHDLGLCLSLEDDQVVAAFLYGERRGGFEPYQGDLPAGLDYTMNEAQVLELCGSPQASSTSPPLRWHKFEQADDLLHVELSPSGDKILKVTLLLAR